MDRPPLQDWTFRAPLPVRGPSGWVFAVEGVERKSYGPWPDPGEAWAERERLFRRWCRLARERGGWAWRPSAVVWAVTLPRGAAVGGSPMAHAPCSRHVPDAAAAGPRHHRGADDPEVPARRYPAERHALGRGRVSVLFDLDGTLVDSAADLHAALNALLGAEGRRRVTEAAARVMIGGGARNLLALAWSASGAPADDAALDRLYPEFLLRYSEILLERTRPYPGAREALDALAGHALAVVTNKPIGPSLRILDGLALTGRFRCVLGGDSLAHRKPHPAMLYAAIEACGGGPAVMVGDSRADFDAARNAGIPCIGVRWGYPGASPEGLAPDAWIERFDELPGAVGRVLAAGR